MWRVVHYIDEMVYDCLCSRVRNQWILLEYLTMKQSTFWILDGTQISLLLRVCRISLLADTSLVALVTIITLGIPERRSVTCCWSWAGTHDHIFLLSKTFACFEVGSPLRREEVWLLLPTIADQSFSERERITLYRQSGWKVSKIKIYIYLGN
jgi:hypothetical protein